MFCIFINTPKILENKRNQNDKLKRFLVFILKALDIKNNVSVSSIEQFVTKGVQSG